MKEDRHKELLEEIAGRENILVDEPMSKHTTFRIGGPADYYVFIDNERTLRELIEYCRENDKNYFILGNGSNILVKDRGYRGIIIDLSGLKRIEVRDQRIYAEAGASLKEIAKNALSASLTGYEFASGIPGSLGGAIKMNAGAYGGEHADVVESVRVLDENGNIKELDREELGFSYRHSIIKDEPLIVVSAILKLDLGDFETIDSKMRELSLKRRTKQPLEYPSAGSTFKRPEGYFAGKLIQDIGYKGKRVGDAQVSEKHSGFVINRGSATAADVLTLIGEIQEKIKDQFGVDIEREVIVIGE